MEKISLIILLLLFAAVKLHGQTIIGKKSGDNTGILESYLSRFKLKYLDTLRNAKISDQSTPPAYSAKYLNEAFRGEICADPRLLRTCNFEVCFAADDMLELGIIEIRYPSKSALNKAKLLVRKSASSYLPNKKILIRFVLVEMENYLVFLLSETPLNNIITRYFDGF
jgi:hypothetical protein